MDTSYFGEQQSGLISSGDIVINLYYFPEIISGIILLLVLIFGLRYLVRHFFGRKYFDHAIYLVRLPKERTKSKPEDNNKKEVRLEQEDIACGEAILSAIGGLRAQRGLIPWFLGRNDHFSFEIVAHKKMIYFYICAPRSLASYLEQQLLANYSDAVMEEVKDYNIFAPNHEVLAAVIKTKKSYIFPIKTYKKMEVDPLNSLVNTLSKLEPDEGAAIQYVVRSAHGRWHQKLRSVVTEIKKGKPINKAVSTSYLDKFFEILNSLTKIFESGKPNDQALLNKKEEKLSAMEEEVVKNIEEKNSKAGLDVNIRIIVSGRNKGSARAYLENISNAYSQYNFYEFGNTLKTVIYSGRSARLVKDFIYRRFNDKKSILLNTEEMNSMFHLPLDHTETPNVYWLTAKHAPAPTNLPEEGILIGENIFRGVVKEVRMKRDDRRRHTYMIGKSGVGKSYLLSSMAIQDILNGEGVCVIDPHGDLIEDILRRIPPSRAEDVIYFSPPDLERPLALNLLEFDPRYPEQKSFVINEMINIFDKLYDLKATGGPIFEQYMRNAMLLIMSDPESGSTLMEIPKVLADEDFRRMKLSKCSDPTVVDFWRKEAEKAGGEAALANVVPYITSKLTSFISNDMMRPIIGQQNSSFNLREIMDNRKILLVNLPKGSVGELNAFLLGMILVGKILVAALSRTDVEKEDRKDFYLYIDEFQNFTTDSICSILSESRKYALNLIMAHQYIGQLIKKQDTSIKDAVFGNVGTWIVFKIGTEDAETIVKEFAPVFNEYDLVNIEKYTAYTKLLIDNTAGRAFSMRTIAKMPGEAIPGMAEKIKNLSRLKYGKDRSIIEEEIKDRTGI